MMTSARQGGCSRRRQCEDGRSPPGDGRVRPGTKESRSRSRSSSSGDPTKYKQCWFLLLHGPVVRDDAAVKATPSAQCYGRVSPQDKDDAVVPKQVSESCIGQRRRFLSSAQVVTDVSFTLTTVKLHDEVIPGAQCMCIRGYICRSPPPACQYTKGVPPPLCAAERGVKCDCPKRLSGR
jgi:hypothetical protein